MVLVFRKLFELANYPNCINGADLITAEGGKFLRVAVGKETDYDCWLSKRGDHRGESGPLAEEICRCTKR